MNTLHLVTGMPAAGKSTYAATLAAAKKACLLDIDTVTEPIIQAAMLAIVGNADDRDSDTFKSTFREPIYQSLFAAADANLPHSDVVIAGPFTRELADPDWPQTLQARFATPFRFECIFVSCSPELLKKRLEVRGNPRDQAKLENWERFLSYYEKAQAPAFPHQHVAY